MTARIERWGIELAEAIRREHELTEELNRVKVEIDETIMMIRTAPSGALYESTSEVTLVRPYIPSVGVEDPAVTVRMEVPDDKLINLAPYADMPTQVGMSPIVSCPPAGEWCERSQRHVHTQDGKVHWITAPA